MPEEQNFYYIKSLERYIDYLQEQMRLAKIYLPIMSRDSSSCNTGLTKTSQRVSELKYMYSVSDVRQLIQFQTVLVHMLQDVRKLYDKVLDEESKVSHLGDLLHLVPRV